MPCHPSHGQAGKDHRSVRRQHKWRPFQAPWEDDPGPGFQEFKLEPPVTPPAEKPPETAGGPDTGVTCFNPLCGQDTYRIIKSKTAEEVLAGLPDEQWRRSQGRGDEQSTPLVFMVICPRCQVKAQLTDEIVQRIRSKKGLT